MPEYQFALIKEIQGGDVDSFGADLRSIMKSHQKFGALEEKYRPPGFSLKEKDQSFLRRIGNWPPELKIKALEHAKRAYVDVLGQYDPFDDIRASLWLFRAEKRVPVFGLVWGWPENKPIIDSPGAGEFGHALYATGWKQIDGSTYLVVINSWGTDTGEGGRFYFSREVINKFAEQFGAYMFIDQTPEEYLARLKPAMQISIIGILQKILQILGIISKMELPPPPLSPPPPTPLPVSAYDWSTVEKAKLSVLAITEEEGLSATLKDQLLKTIECESYFDTKAMHKNKDGSLDIGICQYNSYWYIGPGKPIPTMDVALGDPVFSIRVMCRQFKKGRAKDWICWRRLFGQIGQNGKRSPNLGSNSAKNMELPNWLKSSTGEGVALRWKSLASAVIPAVLLLGPIVGIDIEKEALDELSGGVSQFIVAVWAAGSAVAFIVGWVRRNALKRDGLGKFAPK